MNFNADVIFDRTGQLKIATLVIGIIDLGLTASTYWSGVASDNAFLAAVIICFLFSFFNILGLVTGFYVPTNSETFLRVDLLLHICACIFLGITDIAFLVSVLKYWKDRKKAACIFAWMFGAFNAAIFGFIPFRVWKVGNQ